MSCFKVSYTREAEEFVVTLLGCQDWGEEVGGAGVFCSIKSSSAVVLSSGGLSKHLAAVECHIVRKERFWGEERGHSSYLEAPSKANVAGIRGSRRVVEGPRIRPGHTQLWDTTVASAWRWRVDR